jgi:CTP synthase
VQLEGSTLDKAASSCDVELAKIIAVHNVASTYLVPALLEEQSLLPSISKLLHLELLAKTSQQNADGANMWRNWKILTTPRDDSRKSVTIAFVGKYTKFMDSYMSVLKSLEHSAMACQRKLNLVVVDASHLEEHTMEWESSKTNYVQAWSKVREADGILVPGGFGERGTDGMIAAAQCARENKIPYLGICLGMQIAIIEFARHMCNIPRQVQSSYLRSAQIQLSSSCQRLTG